jgi:hypothetical protein
LPNLFGDCTIKIYANSYSRPMELDEREPSSGARRARPATAAHDKEEKMSQEGKSGASAHEPFVPHADRPAVKPDTRLSDLTVQDLLGVLHGDPIFKPHYYKYHHLDLKAFYSKHEHPKAENFKLELWKAELWKVEHLDIQIPAGQNGPDPPFAQLAQGIEGLRAQVQNLSSEVAAMRKVAT